MAMGGDEFSFPEQLERNYGVKNLADSEERIWQAVERAAHDTLVFLGHNGPVGLGSSPTDPWGCDFKSGGGDWGDSDLANAIQRARASGRRVAAIVAGHMHMHTRAGERTMHTVADGIPMRNAARVPRILAGPTGEQRYHVVMRPDDQGGLELFERMVELD